MSTESSRIRELFKVQVTEFKRDFGAVFFSFVFPLFFVVSLIVTSSMAPNMKFEFGVVDAQGNPGSRKLAEALASGYMTVRSVSMAQADAELAQGKLQAALVMPAQDIEAGGEMRLIANPRFQGFATMALDAARTRLRDAEDPSAARYAFRVEAPPQQVSSDFTFIYPGMLAMAMLQLGLLATATPLLRARERGTLRHLQLTPMRTRELLVAQVGFRMLVAMAQAAILLAAGMYIVDLSAAQWAGVIAVSVVGALALISIGYAIAGLAPNLEAGMAAIMLCNFTMMFGGNIFLDPATSKALWIVAHVLPVSYLADAYRQIINHAEGMWPMWLDLGVLVAWAAVALAVATRSFRVDMGPRARRRPHVAHA
jgi:ABC-2 type transport system permease protein